jgi:NitT/TauT family transport system ATP-binding protein
MSNAIDDLVLETRDLHHWFGPKLVLHDVDLKIVRGQIVSLVGPSGCGKSTLLRALLGTHPPRSGAVVMHEGGSERAVSSPGRDRGIVYQRYGLYPFLTAQQNVAFGPRLDETTMPGRLFGYFQWRKRRAEHMAEAAQILDKLGLGDALKRYPHELSGGMRQRVAIGQALIMKPSILLLDEPFGALDEATREDLQELLLTLYQENMEAKSAGEVPPYTILIVTHELNEAIYVGDRILGLSQYWDYKSAGHAAPPGATIIYDKPAPVYLPGEHKLFDEFIAQRKEIRRIVFEEDLSIQRGEHATYWDDVKAGRAGGVVTL